MAGVRQVAQALESILQQLPRLSVLKVPGIPSTNAAVQAMGALQGLQQVAFADLKHMPLFDLQLLPSSITQLGLMGNTNSVSENFTTLPQQLPQQPTGLLHLDLDSCQVLATMFGSVTQLQALRLDKCRVLPQTLGREHDEEGMPALLDALPKLTFLQELELERSAFYGTIAPRRFSALTASSHLTRLVITAEGSEALPEYSLQYALQYMSPANPPALGLRELTASSRYGGSGPDDSCINGAGLHAIVSRCPALQHLDIERAVQPGADVSWLLQLPQSCTLLRIGGGAFDDTAAGMVAQLTQLRDLTWTHAYDEFTDVGLEQLTALDLHSLCVENNYAMGEVKLSRDPQEGSVSEQLRAVCERSPVIAAARAAAEAEAEASEGVL